MKHAYEIDVAPNRRDPANHVHSLEEEYLKDRNPIMGKCTVKKGSQNGSKTTLGIQKVQQNKQIPKRAKAKKGSKMDLKNGTKNAPKNPA